MKLLIASNNAHKVREIEEILSDYFDEMVTLREAGLVIDVVEDGKTFRENAVKKAMETLEKSGFDAALADEKIKRQMEGMKLVKTIVVKNRIVNLILKPAN